MTNHENEFGWMDDERGEPTADELVERTQEDTVDEPGESGAEAVGEELPYVVEEWGGYPNYRCRYCPYSTLDRAAMETHVAWHRAMAAVAQWKSSGT